MLTKQSEPVLEIKALEDSGEIEGYASTFGGEPDAYGDVIAPGAYADSLADHASKGTMPKILWKHDRREVIGRWTAASEDGKGLVVRGKLNMDVQRGREAYALLKAGAIDGLSIGYRTISAERDGKGRRLLSEVELWEVSLVTFPMLAEAKVGRKSDPAAVQANEMAAAFRAATLALRAE